MTMLVLTVIAEDRPGLVDRVSAVIGEHGGNWEQSHMGQLAGRFAGIVQVRVAGERAGALTAALEDLASEGMQVHVETGDSAPRAPARRFRLALVGQDHPGIVHDIAHALATHEVSIESLETETRSASMSGEPMFHAQAELSAPPETDFDALSATLESLANELMVDLELDAPPD